MSSELAFTLTGLLSIAFVFIASRFGRDWLYVAVVSLALTSSITAGKVVEIFGVAASIATPLYAGIFLATDALSEFYGKHAARRAIWMGFFANFILVLGGQIIVAAPPGLNTDIATALASLFQFIPRLVGAGLLAFLISQNLDVWIYHKLKKRAPARKHIWIRNNTSTVISQLVDSTIVYGIAFAGIIPNLWQIIATAWFVKVVVALCDTPFLYLMTRWHASATVE